MKQEIIALLSSWIERGCPRLSDVREVEGQGPYTTKAGATLWKCFEQSSDQALKSFLQYELPANIKTPRDIRGLRTYMVIGQKSGTIGGIEFHSQRQEVVTCIAGKFEWTCEDLFGQTKTYYLVPGMTLWMDPFILHTFKSLEDESGLFILCNTIFEKDDDRTHDTFSKEVFLELQECNRHEYK